MDLKTDRVCIAPGEGIIARQGGTLLFIDAPQGDQGALADQLLALIEEHDGDARCLVRAVGVVVTSSDPALVPSFGLLVQDGREVLALACGSTRIEVTGTDDHHVMRGMDATTYVERVLAGDLVDAWLTASEILPDKRSRLTSGVVRGGGAQVLDGSVPFAAESPTAMAPTSAVIVPVEPSMPEFESISLFKAEDQAAPPVMDILEPAADSPEAAMAPGAPAVVMVEGIYCSRAHFNNPAAIFCSLCGISMVQQTHNLLRGPRPPLGVLLTDSGDVFVLSRDYVLGREPGIAPEVVSGSSLPLQLVDAEGTMSRVHARILLDGWEVRLTDASSANGTFTSVDGAEWSKLDPERPVTVSPGMRISVGSRTLTFETHQHG